MTVCWHTPNQRVDDSRLNLSYDSSSIRMTSTTLVVRTSGSGTGTLFRTYSFSTPTQAHLAHELISFLCIPHLNDNRATAGLDERGGKGTNGGVWEWTSTLLHDHAGFFPTTHFPGYSTDFFDDKHHVALGGSYATIPRLAGRRTVRNFYQHNYPYPWVGARVAYNA